MKSLPFIVALALLAPSAAAHDHPHDRARRAVESGEILPLRQILDRALADYPGQFVEAELERKRHRIVYEIKLVTPAGRVLELVYDARTGALLKSKEEDE